MKKLIPLLLLLFVTSVIAQSDLPEYGKIEAIKGKTKFYVVASTDNRQFILKEIKNQKELTNVDKAEDAEFFIEYKTLAKDEKQGTYLGTGLSITYETGQLDVYIYRDKKKIIAWSEAFDLIQYRGPTSRYLTKKFLKALSKK